MDKLKAEAAKWATQEEDVLTRDTAALKDHALGLDLTQDLL